MSKIFIQLTTTFLLACSAYSGMAADQLTGEAVATSFTGNGGAILTLNKLPAENDAIFGVEIAERGDDPCFIRLRYRDITTGEERYSRTLAACDDNNANRGMDSSRVGVALPADMVVTGASICLNPKRDKMKGIELRASLRDCVRGESTATIEVDQCGSVFRQGSMEYNLCSSGHRGYRELSCSSSSSVIRRYVERPDCRGTNRGPDADWEKVINCPPGTVATGFKLSTRSSHGDRIMIDGLALECVRVETGIQNAGVE